MTFAPGHEFGQYRILAFLGAGGMGEVYRAHDAKLDRSAAVKVLTRVLISEAEDRKRFDKEARLLANLSHPRIVPVYTYDIQNNVPWIAMLFAAQGSLAELLKIGRLSIIQALTLLAAIAEALDYLHEQPGILVHRDVKPENILLDANNRVYLGDFGLAKIAQAPPGTTSSALLLGTPEYMAPEQILPTSTTLDGRCDVYSLGVVAYELVVGRRPFESAHTDPHLRRNEILQHHVKSPMPERDVPSYAIPVFRKCLAKRPEERYLKASEFVTALRGAFDDTQAATVARPAGAALVEITARPPERPYVDEPDDQPTRITEARVVHLSGINIPLEQLSRWQWRHRWDRLVDAIKKQNPDLILITGDLLDSKRFPTARLQSFVNDIFPESFPNITPLFTPSRAERGFAQELSPFKELPGFSTEWSEVVRDALHIYNVDSQDDAWFSPTIAGLPSAARVPSKCGIAEHLHIAAFHHYVRPTPQHNRTDYDADERSTMLADFGYDLVLYGQSHPADKHPYPLPERLEGLWLLPAPTPLLGFNLITGRTDGFCQVRVIRYQHGRWQPHVIVALDEEEGRTRQWRAQRKAGPGCDRLDVQLHVYKPPPDPRNPSPTATATRAEAHRLCGDLAVKITLHRPLIHSDRLPMPLTRIVGYGATTWREMKAFAISGVGRDRLAIDDEGFIRVLPNDHRDIEITGVLLNAVPATRGDWLRMKASQPDLSDLFRFQPAVAARFLHVRINCPHIGRLHVARQSRTASAFLTVRSEENHDEVTAFRPVVGLTYGVACNGDDPVYAEDTDADEPDLQPWHLAMAAIPGIKNTPRYRRIRDALDDLRDKIIGIIRTLRKDPKVNDIRVDLLSIGDKLRVVMNDLRQQGEASEGEAPESLGIAFDWGQGVAGRALRLTHEYAWTRQNFSGPEQTWPAHEWYYEHAAMAPYRSTYRHNHIYCRPVMIEADGKPYAIALVSFVTYKKKSGLGDLVAAIRADNKQIRDQCDDAFKEFTAFFTDELAQIPDLTEGTDDTEKDD